MAEFYAYHVVTDRPMKEGQTIVFDESHHSGVYSRVMEKERAVKEIYACPKEYASQKLEHHTAVALRELALEEVRRKKYPQYPSRLGCLYVSDCIEDAVKWSELFIEWGRPTYHIVRLRIRGNKFTGDANNCFVASVYKEHNLAMAEHYWNNDPTPTGEKPILEILADGEIEVVKIVREIRENIPRED